MDFFNFSLKVYHLLMFHRPDFPFSLIMNKEIDLKLTLQYLYIGNRCRKLPY
jgi:hypothetical protein